ncbi:dTMP kinase [Natronorubrum sediminis]|uniref:Probable thymidylate kinase n=1 Tax=Natronorubrum sediminis TaxID=640943 RepID=A0A1H6G1N3_9EURY|nr:dTMP kinase [Natronorubrum sediminis]SEH16512.1 dTMP kinase [Natronorubrum sediminis]
MLVTLEGLDGSGKTTVWEALQETYPDATFTREPTNDSWYGDAVYRSIGDDDADSLAELFLYTADHADHLSRKIEPALERGDLVISDRYSDSRFAYQGATLDASDRLAVDDPLEYVVDVHEPFSRPPDLTLYLDVDPKTAAERAGATNKFERVEYLESVHANYERLLEREPERFVRVDASQEPDAVLEEVREVLAEAIGGE